MFSGNDSYTALEYRFFMTSILRFMLAHFCSEKVSKHYDMSSSRPGEMHAVAYGLKSTQPIKYRVIIVNEYTHSFTRSEQQPQLGYKASDKMNTAWVLRYYVSRFLRKNGLQWPWIGFISMLQCFFTFQMRVLCLLIPLYYFIVTGAIIGRLLIVMNILCL